MLLAATDPAASGGGPLGLLIIAILGIVTVLLIRNMSARLKRMPRSFDPPDDDPGNQPSASSDEPR